MRYFSGYIEILKVDQILPFFYVFKANYGKYFDCLDSRKFAVDEYAPYLLEWGLSMGIMAPTPPPEPSHPPEGV